MITAQELRIGNLVTNGIYTGYITVFNNDKCVIRHKHGIERCIIENLKPIPLTEEWLIKLGFVKILKHNEDKLNGFEIKGQEFLHTIKGSDFIFASFFNEIIIKNLHQLQNLYFALTNEELKIN